MADDIFSKILAGEIPSDKVYEDDYTYAFRDISPVAPTHILIISKEKKIERVSDMADNDVEVMGRLFLTAKKVAEQEGIEDFRLVLNNGAGAQQTVFYVHMHLIAGRDLTWPPG